MSEGTCHYCGQKGFWAWDWYKGKPSLLADNKVHKCTNGDIFPGWCTQCKQTDLLLIRKNDEFQLIESHGLPHTCTENGYTDIEDMSSAKCKHCSTTELFWVSIRGRWSLVAADGDKHTCEQYTIQVKAHAEALRMDYAFEKTWINSKADNADCEKCKGMGHRIFLSRNKRLMLKCLSSEPIQVYKPCRHCKRLGKFTSNVKKHYLKNLRKKYWPYFPGVHKWKKDVGI